MYGFYGRRCATARSIFFPLLPRNRTYSYQTESDPNSIGMRLQPFTIGKCGNYRSESLEAVSCQFLRRDVFLKGEGVYAAELACVAVRRQCVVCAGRVITAAIMGRAAGQGGGDEHQCCAGDRRTGTTCLSGENGPTNTLPAFCTCTTAAAAFSMCRIRCSGA